MTPQLLQATRRVVERAERPMTISQIRAEVVREIKVPSPKLFQQEFKQAFSGTPEEPGIHQWKYGSSVLYSDRRLRAWIEEAFLVALDREPLTVPQAAKAVAKAWKRVSALRAQTELRGLAPDLASAQRIVQFAPNRQVVIYFSKAWMGGQAASPAPVEKEIAVDLSGGGQSIAAVVSEIVTRLQSGHGNYVRVDYLRNAPELRSLVDRAVIELADAGELALTRYDGPRPVPEDKKWMYVEDKHGELFIGVMRPNSEEALG